ncbi:hypothetical protein [Streptomyces sp. SceaMP-e96]|uniref:hypothetical protein n=1 Tax=Streptomyces sp. SceaMP-e96 TaxID=1100824 RepID=UPI00406C7FB7
MDAETGLADFPVGGDLPVRRLGFGTGGLVGPGYWGRGTTIRNAPSRCCAGPSSAGSR